jgi:hypothetical protein
VLSAHEAVTEPSAVAPDAGVNFRENRGNRGTNGLLRKSFLFNLVLAHFARRLQQRLAEFIPASGATALGSVVALRGTHMVTEANHGRPLSDIDLTFVFD